jgi:hypothetical protein
MTLVKSAADNSTSFKRRMVSFTNVRKVVAIKFPPIEK